MGLGWVRLLVATLIPLAAPTLGCARLHPTPVHQQVDATFCPPSCPEKLAQLIDRAELSIDMTVYGVTDTTVADALVRAESRNVEVTVIYDYSMYRNYSRKQRSKIDQFNGVGIRTLPFKGRSAFHHKTIILDDRTVWTGSLNIKAMRRLYDNYVLISKPSIVERYREWFAFLEQGPTEKALVERNQRLSEYRANESVQAHFGPSPTFAEPILGLIDEAKDSLDVAVNVLSYPQIVESLILAHQRGVRVHVLLGIFTESTLKSYDRQTWAMERLDAAGVEVWMIARHHQKMMVADDRTVLTGSPGFNTNPLTRNHDNYVIVKSRQVASVFLKEIRNMLASASRYSGTASSSP